ncbi:MAG: hypothetical protein N2485_08605, partial [bacterium]|nr:hypothetical protein [bacterium]
MGSQIIVDLSPLAPTKTTKTFRMYSSTYERISKLAERTGLTIGDLLERMTKTFEDILENKDEYNIS